MRYTLWLICCLVVYLAFQQFGIGGILFILAFIIGHELGFKWGRGRWRTIFD